MSWSLAATHYSGSPASVGIEAARISLSRRPDTWATLSFACSASYTLFDDEADANNPLSVGSTIVLTRDGTQEFTGPIIDIRRNEANAQLIDVTCADPIWWANQAVASVDTVRQFGMASPTVDLEDVPLSHLPSYIGYPPEDKYPVYPTFYDGGVLAPNTHDATSPWLGKDVCPSATLLGNIAGASGIFTVSDIRQFQFPALIQVEDELIYCANGYYDADGDAQIVITTRGALGSSAVDHAPSTIAYQRLLKPIADTGKATTYYVSGGNSIIIGTDIYRIREEAAHFAFISDPSGYSGLKADYSVYDLDATAALTLDDFVTEVLTATPGNLGAGFSAGDLDFSGLDTIRIARLTSTNVRYALEAVNQIVNETRLRNVTAARRLIHYYDAPTSKWVFRSVTQDAATATLPYARRKLESVSLGALYNGALVTYQCDEPFSLVSAERMWHPAIGDATTNTVDGTKINAILYQQMERQNAYGWQADTATASNNIYTQYLLDNDEATGWGIRADGVMAYGNEAPVGWQYILTAWFSGASTIDRAWFTVDLRGFITGDVAYELVGLSVYSGSGLPAEANVVRLSKRLYLIIADIPTRANLPSRSIWLGPGGPGEWVER